MNNRKMNKTEEILNSLDGAQRANAPSFFYTRLKARMEKGMAIAPRSSWRLRPAFAFTALLIVLLVNALVVLKNKNNTPEVTANNDVESYQSLAAEYSVTDAGSLYDLNAEK
jgi:hypothetical protein